MSESNKINRASDYSDFKDSKSETLISDQYKVNQSKDNVEYVDLDKSGEIPRNAPKSPVYNRFKYYSALRTGYQQLNPEERKPFLEAPKHVTEPIGYYIRGFFSQDDSKK